MEQEPPLFPRLTQLGEVPVASFLKDFWQQKPGFFKAALPGFSSLLSAEELAGLSLEYDVTSRLIVEDPKEASWSLTHGPLPESTFHELPPQRWTLLVEHADGLDPEVNALLNAFRFIPNWRLDDIMISYACEGGGVGPHFDYFDVFLLQGQGKRRWKMGQRCDASSPLVPNQPMKILERFETTQEWVAEPGDLIYIPAQCAHWGEAIGDCITYSIGFRAPSHADILLDLSQELASQLTEDQRYRDLSSSTQTHPGEITDQTINTLQDIAKRLIQNKDTLSHWFGEYSTRSHCPTPALENTLSSQALLDNVRCGLNPFCRIAFKRRNDEATCFINGQGWCCSIELAIQLSEYRALHYMDFDQNDRKTLNQLTEQGFLIAM